MTKLRLKRTPEEERDRARRKAYKAARRSTRDDLGRRKKNRTGTDDDATDHDGIRAELEDMRFREKMWDAFAEDERLDSVNARFNDYGHIPDRWSRDEHDIANPQYMDNDEYAEWIREGMWKKKHAREYEEQAKRDAERAFRKKREKEIKAETVRLERIALEQEERRRKERRRQREEEYRQQYEERWKVLLDHRTRDPAPLVYWDIPWPLFSVQVAKRKAPGGDPLHMEDVTSEAIATFLLPDADDIVDPAKNDDILRRNRDKLKETLLRFHPDKFEGRIMHRVRKSDVESVRDAVGQVARVLNALMNEKPR